jgi:hypothetical protein
MAVSAGEWCMVELKELNVQQQSWQESFDDVKERLLLIFPGAFQKFGQNPLE